MDSLPFKNLLNAFITVATGSESPGQTLKVITTDD